MAILLACTLFVSGAGNISQAFAENDLPQVQGLTAIPGDKKISLQWQKSAEPEVVGYRLYLSLDRNNFNSFLDLGTVNEHTDTNLRNGTIYYYAIAARNNNQEEGPRTVLEATPGVDTDTGSGASKVAGSATDAFLTTANPPGGIYHQPQTVLLSNNDQSAIIFYTLDGTDPKIDFTSPSVKTYTGPVIINQSAVLKHSARSAGSGKIEDTRTSQYIIKQGDGPDIIFPPLHTAPPEQPSPGSQTEQPAPSIPGVSKIIHLTADPSSIEVGEEHQSQVTASFRDYQGSPLIGEELNFELSTGDGKTHGQLSNNSAVTDQQGQAKINYLASRFAGVTIITARSKSSPTVLATTAITQTPGGVASVSLPLKALVKGQDNNVVVSILDRFKNPVTDNTTVILSLTITGTKQTETFRAQTKNGIATIIIPAAVITARDYQVVASASGVQSEIVSVKVGGIDKLQESGPETAMLILVAVALCGLILFTKTLCLAQEQK